MTQDDLAQRIHAELCQNFGALPAPVWQRVIAEKRATYACTVGLPRPAQRTPLGNFYLAGDYTESDYPATPRSGGAQRRRMRAPAARVTLARSARSAAADV